MSQNEWLADQFEDNRARLRAAAYRMLGSAEEAEDAVQETWLRLSRATPGGVENLGGWLTTVVSRICLDMLRSRRSRREISLDERLNEPASRAPGPESEAMLADSVGTALLVVLETLSPAERVAFVLHDMFDVPFAEIAAILGRTADASRQLASRARRRVRDAPAAPRRDRREEIVAAFLAAARGGDLQALLALLDPDAVLHADTAAARLGTPPELKGAKAIADTFSGRASGAQRALVDGIPGLAFVPGGRLRGVFAFRFQRDRIVEIDVVGDPARLRGVDLTLLGD
ncbi:MAG TPA: sigma-70 family RNA polymerase sigma factor [Trueperaceae bacterium]|nr:sigma-70 family RNA polymerase sigma factor [Trueperaceae bacterium]